MSGWGIQEEWYGRVGKWDWRDEKREESERCGRGTMRDKR